MTNAELAILTLIAERPRHGYEIEQVIEERGMRDWTEVGFSSIYYLLKKLEKNALIEGRTERPTGQGPARVVYRITSAGRETVYAGVVEALSIPQHCYPLIQLGLANLPGISKAESLTALHKYHKALADRLSNLRSNWESKGPLPYFIDAMFDYSTTIIRAELTWIDKFIGIVEEEHGENRLQEGTETPL